MPKTGPVYPPNVTSVQDMPPPGGYPPVITEEFQSIILLSKILFSIKDKFHPWNEKSRATRMGYLAWCIDSDCVWI